MNAKAKIAAMGLLTLCFTGCANTRRGSAASAETGVGSSSVQSETLTPGVASALFPEPGWREPTPPAR